MAIDAVGLGLTIIEQVIRGLYKIKENYRAYKEMDRLFKEVFDYLHQVSEIDKRLERCGEITNALKNARSHYNCEISKVQMIVDNIHDKVVGKSRPLRFCYAGRVKRVLDEVITRLQNITERYQLGEVVWDSTQHLERRLTPQTTAVTYTRSWNTLFDLSPANKLLPVRITAKCLRLLAVDGIAQGGTKSQLSMYLDMLHQSAQAGDEYAAYEVPVERNLGLVKNRNAKESEQKFLDVARRGGDLGEFAKGQLHLLGFGQYRNEKCDAFEIFVKLSEVENSQQRHKAAYIAGLCCRFQPDVYGASDSPQTAIQYMMRAAPFVLYAAIDLAATYKHGVGVERNLEVYRKYVETMEERAGNSETIEVAAILYQGECYMSPFHRCDIDCCYLGFCYLNGICVERDEPRGLKFIERSAEAGNLLAKRILDDLASEVEILC